MRHNFSQKTDKKDVGNMKFLKHALTFNCYVYLASLSIIKSCPLQTNKFVKESKISSSNFLINNNDDTLSNSNILLESNELKLDMVNNIEIKDHIITTKLDVDDILILTASNDFIVVNTHKYKF